MTNKAPKWAGSFRVTCALLLAALFVAGQALHAAAGTSPELCRHKASAVRSSHHSADQHSAHHTKHCCDADPVCDCHLKESADPVGLPFVSAADAAGSHLLHSAGLDQSIAVISRAPERTLGMDWARARAPSETLFPDTTRLIC